MESPGAGVIGICRWVLEIELSPLQEQYGLLNTESALQSFGYLVYCYFFPFARGGFVTVWLLLKDICIILIV